MTELNDKTEFKKRMRNKRHWMTLIKTLGLKKSSGTLSHKGKQVPLPLRSTKGSRWFAQQSAEMGPEELPSGSSISCPEGSKALQNAEGFTSVTVLRKDHWSGVAAALSAERHAVASRGEK